MKKLIGKNQSYCREINFELVINLLRQKPRSATQLAEELELSNATMSSIIKDLLELKMIDVSESVSVKGSGRKQVFYTLNNKYGLILVVNIAHKKADVNLINLKEDVVANATLYIDDINESSINQVILKANELLFNSDNKAPLKNIVISIVGLVKDKTEGQEKHYVQTMFENYFRGVPTYLTNDGNLITYGELSRGEFLNTRNGVMVLLDYGIGGSIVINNKLFRGDNGYAGEMGHMLCESNGTLEYLEDVASLRVLLEKAGQIVNKKLKMEDLFELYESNKIVHELVLKSAENVGKALKSIVDVLDIETIVLAGRVSHFGEDYLRVVRVETDKSLNKAKVIYSPLKDKGVILGGAYIGVDYILKKSLSK